MHFLLILVVILITPLAGCAAMPSRPRIDLSKTARSFVFIAGNRTHLLCTPGETPGRRSCTEIESSLSASGFVVVTRSKKSYVMTAGHVCDGKIGDEEISYLVSVELFVTDRDGAVYQAHVVDVDLTRDICLLNVPDLDAPALKLSKREPSLGSKAFNVAAPLGLFYPGDPGMLPMFDGRYSGKVGNRSFFTIPAVGGSSGSPVLNEHGRVIGMIVARHVHFNHISVSPTRRALIDFLADALDK